MMKNSVHAVNTTTQVMDESKMQSIQAVMCFIQSYFLQILQKRLVLCHLKYLQYPHLNGESCR